MTTNPLLETTTTPEDRMNVLQAEIDLFVGPHDFNKVRGDGDFFVLDVRSTDSYEKGHLPGAHNIPRAKIEQKMGDIPKDKSVVVYCSDITCFASKKAARTLYENGYENVRVLYGGFEGWQKKDFDVETGIGKTEQVATAPTA